MTKRQKKKLKNRAGFFHYRDYKLRVKILYDIFGSVVNNDGPYAFKQYMFDYAKTVIFMKVPTKIFNRKYRRYGMPKLENCVGSCFGRFADIESVADKNGYKPGELAAPLPRGPLESRYGNKSVVKALLSSTSVTAITNRIPDNPTKASSACEAMGMEVD